MRWGVKYSCCLWCGTTDVKYKANGFCKKCYYKFYNVDYEKKHNALCSLCEKVGSISTKKDNKVICKRCYKKHYFKLKKKRCYFCSALARIDKKVGSIEICHTCYDKIKPRPKRLCKICNEFEESHLKEDGGFICKYCYGHIHEKNRRECVNCGEEANFIGVTGEPWCYSCDEENDPNYPVGIENNG